MDPNQQKEEWKGASFEGSSDDRCFIWNRIKIYILKFDILYTHVTSNSFGYCYVSSCDHRREKITILDKFQLCSQTTRKLFFTVMTLILSASWKRLICFKNVLLENGHFHNLLQGFHIVSKNWTYCFLKHILNYYGTSLHFVTRVTLLFFVLFFKLVSWIHILLAWMGFPTPCPGWAVIDNRWIK